MSDAYSQNSQLRRMSLGMRATPSSPNTSAESSSGMTRLSRYASVSTFATSSNAVESADWYEDKMQETGIDENPEYDVEVRLPVSQRPKGRYSLNDFTLMRTVGTGSFGRVHLGTVPFLKF